METFADRLRWAMENKKTSQSDLARAVGVNRATINFWVSGKTKEVEGSNLSKAANFLGVTPLWLTTGKGPKEPGKTVDIYWPDDPQKKGPTPAGLIPVISWIKAGAWSEIVDHLSPGDADKFIPIYRSAGPHSFALEIKGRSMEPEFFEGDTIVVDPNLAPNPGDYVVAKNDEDEATFKKYRPRGVNEKGETYFELVPLNPDFEPMRSDLQRITIIGVAIDHYKVLRR